MGHRWPFAGGSISSVRHSDKESTRACSCFPQKPIPPFFIEVFGFLYKMVAPDKGAIFLRKYADHTISLMIREMAKRDIDDRLINGTVVVQEQMPPEEFNEILARHIKKIKYTSAMHRIFQNCQAYQEEIDLNLLNEKKEPKQSLWTRFVEKTNRSLEHSKNKPIFLLLLPAGRYQSLIDTIRLHVITFFKEKVKHELKIILQGQTEQEMERRYLEVIKSNTPLTCDSQLRKEIINEVNDELAQNTSALPPQEQQKIKEIMSYKMYKNIIIKDKTRRFILKEIDALSQAPLHTIDKEMNSLLLRANHMWSEGQQVSQHSASSNAELIDLFRRVISSTKQPDKKTHTILLGELDKILANDHKHPKTSIKLRRTSNVDTIETGGLSGINVR